jgi:hypothetical protein
MLRVEVAGAGLDISIDLRRSVERRLLYALTRFGTRVERVAVRLSDVANPLGGVDRRCQMQAWLGEGSVVHVETLDGPSAIARAVTRLAQRVEWALDDGRREVGALLVQRVVPPSSHEPATRGTKRSRLVHGVGPAKRKRGKE